MQELGDTLNEMIVRLRESTEKVKEVSHENRVYVFSRPSAAHPPSLPLSGAYKCCLKGIWGR